MDLLNSFDIQWFEQFNFKTMNQNPAKTFHSIAKKQDKKMSKYAFSNSFVKILFSISLFYVLLNSIEAVEIRAEIHNCLNVQAILMSENADYHGDYAFKDHVYSDLNSHKNLNDEFFRIREYQITRWEQKPVVVVHKIRDLQLQNHEILFEKEFDTVDQTLQYIPKHFSNRCFFFRRGWEYRLNNMRIFVEEIDGLPPSIEIIAGTQEEVFNLFSKIKIVNILSDSVPQWYCKSNKDLTNQKF